MLIASDVVARCCQTVARASYLLTFLSFICLIILFGLNLGLEDSVGLPYIKG